MTTGSGAAATTGAPLRRQVVQAFRSGAVPDDLQSFIKAEPVSALASWFGAEAWSRLASGGTPAIAAALIRDIAEIDRIVGAQLNAILHHPRLQQLEASWRGLAYLVGQLEETDNIVVKVLNARWGELARDFERSIEFDQSYLFAKVYNDEFGMPGGQPYGVLLCDYFVQLQRSPAHPSDDVGAMSALSQVAAAAFAPAVLSCAPDVVGLSAFSELGGRAGFQDIVSGPAYRRWQRLRETEDARFVGLVLPRVLMRKPYSGPLANGLVFSESTSDPAGGDLLWGNAVYAFGAVLVRSFRSHGWFADIRGTPGPEPAGGIVTNLPTLAYGTDRAGTVPKPPVETLISEVVERQLADLGVNALSTCRLTPHLAFLSAVSLKQPEGDLQSPAALTNARLSCMLHYMLCVSRFSHYIKVIARDGVGSFTSPEDLERLLGEWLRKYQLANDDASLEMKAQFPLRDGSVRVRPHATRPGVFKCAIHLQPHFQLDQVISTFRLTTELATSEAIR